MVASSGPIAMGYFSPGVLSGCCLDGCRPWEALIAAPVPITSLSTEASQRHAGDTPLSTRPDTCSRKHVAGSSHCAVTLGVHAHGGHRAWFQGTCMQFVSANSRETVPCVRDKTGCSFTKYKYFKYEYFYGTEQVPRTTILRNQRDFKSSKFLVCRPQN